MSNNIGRSIREVDIKQGAHAPQLLDGEYIVRQHASFRFDIDKRCPMSFFTREGGRAQGRKKEKATKNVQMLISGGQKYLGSKPPNG